MKEKDLAFVGNLAKKSFGVLSREKETGQNGTISLIFKNVGITFLCLQ
jgi:hypothetical protein